MTGAFMGYPLAVAQRVDCGCLRAQGKLTMDALEIRLRYTGHNWNSTKLIYMMLDRLELAFNGRSPSPRILILNDEIITQAPSLKEPRSLPASGGELGAHCHYCGDSRYRRSDLQIWDCSEEIIPIGHLIRSAYDYVISETLGFHVVQIILGEQFEELPQSRLDSSLMEKTETAIKEMHRPISKSRTANKAELITKIGPVKSTLSHSRVRRQHL